jgi:hypothetical protein
VSRLSEDVNSANNIRMSSSVLIAVAIVLFAWWFARWVYEARSIPLGWLLYIVAALITVGVCTRFFH